MVLFVGCSTLHESFKYGGSEDNFKEGVSIYYQLEISKIIKVKRGDETVDVLEVKPVPIGKEFDVDDQVNGLALGVYVKNTREKEVEVWERFELYYGKDTEPYYISRKLEKSRLPDMVRTINLPRKEGSIVVYRVEVVDGSGYNLFTIGDIKYSVGVKK
jgi:hypothetical protein